MSTPKSTNQQLEPSAPIRPTVSHRKAKPDAYTVLLVIALLAVLLGILFLYRFNKDYEFKYKDAPNVVTSQQVEKYEFSLLTNSNPVLTVG